MDMPGFLKKMMCVCLWFHVCGLLPAHADGPKTLSIAEALKMAQDRNPTFSKAGLKHESARLTFLKTMHGLGWVESFTSSVNFNRDESFDYKIYNTTTSRRTTFTDNKKMDYKSSWDLKRTQSSGLQVGLYTKLNSNRTQTKYQLIGQAESLTDQTSSKYRYTGEKMNPEVGVNLTMPITGADKNSTQYSSHLAESAWAQARTDFEQARMQLVFSVRQGYYDLLNAREMTKLRKKVLLEGEERLEITRKRMGVGLTTELSVSQAELAVLRNRADLADAVFSEQQSLSRFNSLIGFPLDEYYDLSDNFPPEPSGEMTLKVIQSRAVSSSRQLKRADEDVEMASVKVEQAKGKLSPEFAFTSNLAMEGERRTFRKVLRDPEPKYAFGVKYEFPFGEKVVEKADVELAQGALSEKVIRRDELNQSLILDATETYQEILKIRQRLSIARQSTEVAGRSLQIARAKYDEGRAEITEVISAKEALVNAQVEELSNIYSLSVSIAQLELLTGESL